MDRHVCAMPMEVWSEIGQIQAHFDFRMLLLEPRYARSKPQYPEGYFATNGQETRVPAKPQAPHRAEDPVESVADLIRDLERIGGRRHLTRTSVEQPKADLLLERSDLMANSTRADMQLVGGFAR